MVAPFSPITQSSGSGGSGEPPELTTGSRPRYRRRRRRVLLAGGVLVIVATAGAGGAAVATHGFSENNHPGNGVADNADPTGLHAVTRGSLSSQISVDGSLGYAGSYNVLNQASGKYTSLPSAGRDIRRGQVLYRVSNAPVVLLYGSVPVYRDLSEGMSGPDVRQLNQNLVALGYAHKAHIADDGWDYFSWETAYALELYQKHLGITETGELTTAQAVFQPSSLRVISVNAQIGGAAGPGAVVLQGTSTVRQVVVHLDASEQTYVAKGDKVTVTLPGNRATPGLVSSVGTVATTPSGSTTPVVNVDISITDAGATGDLDQAPVQVSITTASASNVLIVPIDALIATTSGGYAVEVVGANGVHRLIPVTVGLFDDAAGTVQVSGTGLAAGQEVVVPRL